VSHLVLLNTYYGHASSFQLPEMIRLLADPNLVPLVDALLADPNQRLWLLAHTARRFGMEALDPNGLGVHSILAQFVGADGKPDSLEAIRDWTANLFPALTAQDQRIANGDLASLDVPVTALFGEDDAYLSVALAQHLVSLFSHGRLHPVRRASHWPQWDQPEQVAHGLLAGAS
jgi:pimeloyl-ACP methyl ester carboxylesterase